MRKFLFLVMLFFVGFVSTSKAQDKIEVYGGYSFVRSPVTFFEFTVPCVSACGFTAAHDLNLNGWEASAAYRIAGPLAFKADFAGDYGSFRGASAHLQTYLFGPQIRLHGPISPFAHALIGDAHESTGAANLPGELVSGPTQNSFAVAFGAGIDIKVLPFISLRPAQFDYLVTRFSGGTQNQPRFSAGVVFHF
ncbi:MAG TPA: hypothetical protein VGI16_12770 [Candidatus Acidoferrum sp.]|jgi:hypothetical protein